MRPVGFGSVEVIAHRGVRTREPYDKIVPENIIPAFQQAAELGASIELDVIATTDGRLLVHHDDKTGRLFTLKNGEKRVRQTSFAEMQAAAFNAKGHEETVRKMLGAAGAQYQTPQTLLAENRVTVPELEPALDAVPDTHVYAELKTYDSEVLNGKNNLLEKRMVDLIRRRNWYHRVTAISFSPLSLRKVKKLDKDVQTGWDIPPLPSFFRKNHAFAAFLIKMAQWLGVASIHPCYQDTTPQLVQRIHQAGLKIAPWVRLETRQEEQNLFPTLLAMGVDGIITNAPDALVAALEAGESRRPTSTGDILPLPDTGDPGKKRAP